MNSINLGSEFAKELTAETMATRKCLERIPEHLYEYKPHEKSMPMGYLTLLVAEIPKWITHMIVHSEIDFATFPHVKPANTAELMAHFDENIAEAKKELEKSSNESFEDTFYLKNQGQVIFSASKKENIASTLNHWVHHRGQLTVYMRLNDIPVPSKYGPSADDKGF